MAVTGVKEKEKKGTWTRLMDRPMSIVDPLVNDYEPKRKGGISSMGEENERQ